MTPTPWQSDAYSKQRSDRGASRLGATTSDALASQSTMMGVVTFDEVDEWDDSDTEIEDFEPFLPRRRRLGWRSRLVALTAALSMLAIPLYNVIDGASPQVADNGLEVCRFDYCIIEQRVRDEGLGNAMARMAASVVPDSEVQSFVDAMVRVVGGPDISASVVDELPGDLGGRYSPATRTIEIDRPATVWLIAHEVAHSVSTGHGDDFQRTLIELGAFFDGNSG